MRKIHHKKLHRESKMGVFVLIVLSILCILPLMMVVSASLTDERYIQEHGYSLLPMEPSLNTYRFLIANRGKMILRAMLLTVGVVVLGTIYSVTIVTCFAYSVTQKKAFPVRVGSIRMEAQTPSATS